MQIVIDIDDEDYERLKEYTKAPFHSLTSRVYEAIANGIPLPEGHGRLGDLDAVMDDICNSINEMTKIGLAVDGEYLWGKLNDAIYNATTIIEADKAESEEV